MSHCEKHIQNPISIPATRRIGTPHHVQQPPWRTTDKRKPSPRSISTGLPVAVQVKKKFSSHSVPAPRRKFYNDDPTCSTVQAVASASAEDIMAPKETVPSGILKTKTLKKNNKLGSKTASALPQPVISEGGLEDKRQEFMKFRTEFIQKQNEYIDRYAELREMATRSGMTDAQPVGEVRVVSVTDWPAHDLMFVTETATTNTKQHHDIKGVLGPKILQQLSTQVSDIRDDVLAMGSELMRSRMDLLKFIRAVPRNENRALVYEGECVEWQTKNAELDEETTKLRELVLTTVKTLEAKLTHSLDVAKMPWSDRDNMLKKIERLQREISTLKRNKLTQDSGEKKKILEDLHRERASNARLKEILLVTEERASASRARCNELERQLSNTTSRPKWATPPKLTHSNCHGTSHDLHLNKSELKNEVTVEVLSRQRDTLQFKVKELQERNTVLTQEAEQRETQLSTLLLKLADQEKRKDGFETQAHETAKRLKDLQDQYNVLQERSRALIEAQHKKCLEYLPRKVPCSCGELDILYDLQATKDELGRMSINLELSRVGKKVMHHRLEKGVADKLQSEEQTIANLHQKIEELTRNKKRMEENLTYYENQISTLRAEVCLLRSFNDYKSCSVDIPHAVMESQVFDLCLQVERLTREREALASEAMTRALLLERHERCAELFARVTRAKHDLAAQLADAANNFKSTPSVPCGEGNSDSEMSDLMSKTYLTSASTWSALRTERERVLRLEGVVHAQAQQLERESLVRIKQDRKRAQLERELLRTWASANPGSRPRNPFREAETLTTDSLHLCKKDTAPALDLTLLQQRYRNPTKDTGTVTSDSLQACNIDMTDLDAADLERSLNLCNKDTLSTLDSDSASDSMTRI
ncbi:uncharacterized protein LOC125228508 isoform X2 [Leguminivora glycinivorella]|uniref:uncharacterized protein LOC125228508 isoform X2 n=1 Tax=Leguminivora glycinivorella TaxID=1035111 RepID=UPI00200DD966|nr:uncharacterized protein LOC125228508 isoform X2 [Leguminivora glycinivorella]